jgi:hypothetical protein
MGIGGSAFFFLLQSATGLARKVRPETFKCTPGEGPNNASNLFSYVAMGVSTVQLVCALLNTWSGPHAVNTGRVRMEYFRNRDGRPTLGQMIDKYFVEAAFSLVPRYAIQRISTGPAAKSRAEGLILTANRQLDELSRLGATEADRSRRGPDAPSAPARSS